MRHDREELLLLLLEPAELREVVHRRHRRDDRAAGPHRASLHVHGPVLARPRIAIDDLETGILAGEPTNAHRAERCDRLARPRVAWLKDLGPSGGVRAY